jgi:DNA-damage-inducible protein D
MENALSTFYDKKIRKAWHNEEWYFSIVDIIEVLTSNTKPKTYWSMLKKWEPQVVTICELLKMEIADKKFSTVYAFILQKNEPVAHNPT